MQINHEYVVCNRLHFRDWTLCWCGFLGCVNTAAESGCQSCIWVINCVNRSCLSHHTVREHVGLCGLQRWRCELCVIWRFRSSHFPPPELLSTQMLHSPPKYNSCCRLMKIWWMNSQLDWTLVVSDSDKTFSFMDVAIFTFIQTVFGCKLLCERDISTLTAVSKCSCQSRKLTVWT